MGADIGLMQERVLVEKARKGDSPAFAELYRREAAPPWRLAQAVTGDPEVAHGAVADAFSKVLTPAAATRTDRHAPIRQQLLTATRDAANERGARGVTVDAEQPVSIQAYRQLPERWRSALWLADGEGLDDDEIGWVLGLSTPATTQLVSRARAGVRERFVETHLAGADDPDCRRTADHLDAYASGELPTRATHAVRRHLDECDDCRGRLVELDGITAAVLLALLPLPLLLFGSVERAWAAAAVAPTGSLGLLLPGGRRIPAWAERAVAASAAAVITLGITGAIIVGGRGNARDPRLARDSETAIGSGDGESALGGGDTSVVVPGSSLAPGRSASAVDVSTPVANPAAVVAAAPAAPVVPVVAAAPVVPVTPAAPVTPVTPVAPPAAPAAPESSPAIEVKVGVPGIVSVSVSDECTGISVLGTTLLCDPQAGSGLTIGGSLLAPLGL